MSSSKIFSSDLIIFPFLPRDNLIVLLNKVTRAFVISYVSFTSTLSIISFHSDIKTTPLRSPTSTSATRCRSPVIREKTTFGSLFSRTLTFRFRFLAYGVRSATCTVFCVSEGFNFFNSFYSLA